MGNAPAAETSGSMGVGPGDIRRYLFIMGVELLSLTAYNRTSILDIIVADGYMMGHLFYKVLLSRYTRWKVFVLADSRAARHMAALRSPSLSEALGLARPFTRSRKLGEDEVSAGVPVVLDIHLYLLDLLGAVVDDA